MLEINNLQYWYKPRRPVLKEISFSVKRGQIACLLGPNGTGKTTLLRCLLGLQAPRGGSVFLDGKNMSHLSAKKRARLMAYVPQSSGLAFPYEVREIVLMGRVAYLSPGGAHKDTDRQAVFDAMEKLEIEHLAKRSFQELSGGERQMVLVARALAQQSDLLIMDEPTANLDYSNQVKILKTIKHLSAQGYGILMTSHYPDHAFLACDNAVLMRDGRVMIQGTPEEAVTSESLTKLYETPVEVSEALTSYEKVKVCIPLLGCP
ncbi:MAG: ABC transporter ATP-binding protein [Desulfitobacterium sp.]|nr:ABC transporter ATP-binding protein [Desulfitobacterium sp.]